MLFGPFLQLWPPWALGPDTCALGLTSIVLARILVILVPSRAMGIPRLIAAVLLVYLIAVRRHFY